MATSAEIQTDRIGAAVLQLRLIGDWVVGTALPAAEPVLQQLAAAEVRALRFDCSALSSWDSLLLTFLLRILSACEARGLAVDRSGLPAGVLGLLSLAQAVPERPDTARLPVAKGLLESLGRQTLAFVTDFWRLTEFIGEATLAFGRMLIGRARLRAADVWRLIEECGPNAIPIISLISVLVGMILAFIGAVQLRLFGAEVYIADLVGLGMAREMGAMMTAILLAGRTGAAFAAELGSMEVNDELDAFRTSGLPPMEFLVLPRILALFAVTPFLCVYADVLGMFGGAVVAAGLFDLSFPEYFFQIRNRLTLTDFGVGIWKSAVFGVLIAVAGCLRGLQCGRSSTAVGRATTSAVVTGIVFIIVADAIMNLIVTTLNVYQR